MAEVYELFRALGDPTRETMVERLTYGPLTVAQLSEGLELSRPAITKHLNVLEDAGIIEREKVGRHVECRLMPAPLTELADWLTDRWVPWLTRG